MVFSSHLFVFGFLPLALVFCLLAPRRARNLVLTLVSYVFYGWAHPPFVLLLLLSTAIDWWAGLVQGTGRWWPFGAPLEALAPGGPRSVRQRRALWCSITANLALLGFFKYAGMAARGVDALARLVGGDAAGLETALDIALPLGISFYTFQSMSYSIDVYRGHAAPMRSFVDFACFVSMFPQLVAGPIIRFSEVADQLGERTLTAVKFARGVAFFSIGLAKKVLLANPCGKVADTVWGAASSSVLDSWYGLLSYALQIYFDFSGYSVMAIGLGLMLGFVFPKNIDAPYHATSIADFWRRWHISLSTWLRDYLYVPLGGNRRGVRRTYANLAAVMLLGGLWHGAALTFVVWGAVHGALLAFERAFTAPRWWRAAPRWGRSAAVFGVVLLTWVPFRAPDLPAAWDYYCRLAGRAPLGDAAALLPGIVRSPYLLGSCAAALVITFAGAQTFAFTRTLSAARAALCLGLLVLSLAALATQEWNPFLYFIF